MRRRVLRLAAFAWALPNTMLGCVLVPLALMSGGRLCVVDGVLEISGGFVAILLEHAVPLPGGVLALTLGHTVLGRDEDALRVTRVHERVHVRQYERWGPLFLPAYGIASIVAFARGRDPYRGNRFEREAYGKDGT